MTGFLHKNLSNKIIAAYYKVYNTLGYEFLEKVYENSMYYELRESDYKVEKQKPIEVLYNKERVGEYFADLVVEDKIIVELKAAESLCKQHEVQLINYLKATNMEIGLLLNFGKEPEFKRKIFTNDLKSV